MKHAIGINDANLSRPMNGPISPISSFHWLINSKVIKKIKNYKILNGRLSGSIDIGSFIWSGRINKKRLQHKPNYWLKEDF